MQQNQISVNPQNQRDQRSIFAARISISAYLFYRLPITSRVFTQSQQLTINH